MVVDAQSAMYTELVSAIGGVPLAPHFRLRHDQLAQVFCQVRFATILRLRERDAVIPFQEAIRDRYPLYSEQQAINLLVTPGGVTQQPAPELQYRFTSSDRSHSVFLAPDFVALESRDYADIDDFAGRLVPLVATVCELYDPAAMTRFGLRFVNEIRLSSADPTESMIEAMTPALLGPVGDANLTGVLQSAQQLLHLKAGTDTLVLRHGLHRDGGTTVDPPPGGGVFEPSSQPFYLLDLDAFTEATAPFTSAGVQARVSDFNEQIRSLFAWAVREDYRLAVMGQEASRGDS
jgi:uncharacterized protein (TIGR04255 family)